MFQRLAQNSRMDLISWNCEPIVHPLALTPCGYNAGFAQIGEVTGDFRLAGAQDFYEVANTNFAIRNEVQQPKPGGIGERAKQEIERRAFP
jgi:hypothetical protein